MGKYLDATVLAVVGLPFVILALVAIAVVVFTLAWLAAGVLLSKFAFEQLVVALLLLAVLGGGATNA